MGQGVGRRDSAAYMGVCEHIEEVRNTEIYPPQVGSALDGVLKPLLSIYHYPSPVTAIETNGYLNVNLEKPFIKPAALLLILIVLSGCSAKPLDPWSQFMHTVITSAQDHDYNKLMGELSLYHRKEIEAFFRQASVLEAVSPENVPDEQELYSAMLEDVKMFVRSYEDLFTGKPVTYSTKRLDIDGVDLFSVILWVKKDRAYSGILVHAVWQRPADFKVLEWVYTEPSDDPRLFKKRAKLKVYDVQACEFPPVIEFDYRMK